MNNWIKDIAPKTDAELQKDYAKLYDLLSSLIHRIKAEEQKGTPLHPSGHPDCLWNKDYPAQYMAALQYVEKINRRLNEEVLANE